MDDVRRRVVGGEWRVEGGGWRDWGLGFRVEVSGVSRKMGARISG